MAALAGAASCVSVVSVPSGVAPCFVRSNVAGRSLVGTPAFGSARLIWSAREKTKRPGHVAVSVVAATAPEDGSSDSDVVTTPKKIGKGVVRLRLSRLGRKKRPFYRIVATHSSWRRDGKAIELLGHYDPLLRDDGASIVVKSDRIKYWLAVGAQPSDTVAGILHKVGILKPTSVSA